ncbi:MAG: sugar phosphate isomerase/epimerase [Pseudomonadota bacterium]|nr:sugar phosphate isomerase/epimerase [Pseudomonadota bacterium]
MLAGLAASNIAWPHRDFERALELLPELGLTGMEIAPYNVFGTWDVADEDIRALRSRIEAAGLVCPALQGILFGVPGAALFESDEARRALAQHLEKVARMASLLGASACVLGAPRQRDPGNLQSADAQAIAIDFLRSVAAAFGDRGTSLAFEANARLYACRFVTTTREAVDLVRAVDRPGIALQIDMGTIFLEGEDPLVLHDAAPLAAHAHVSEPNLQPLGSEGLDHRPLASALKTSGYAGFLSIEMRSGEGWEAALRHAARLLQEEYL